MARIPCSFSAPEEFILRIDARAESLGMKRSEFIVHALRKELMESGHSFSIVAEQSQIGGSGNRLTVSKASKKHPKKSRAKKGS